MNAKHAKRALGDLIGYLVLVLAVLLVIMPLAWIISTSIKPSVEIFAKPPRWIPKAPTLQNYITVLTQSDIPKAFLNSFLTGLMAALASLLLGGSAGYAFARFRFRGNKGLSLFMLISQMLPLTVLMIPMYYMENRMGLIDTRFGLAMAHLVICMPLVTWMTRGYFKSIPKEMEEAAMGRLQYGADAVAHHSAAAEACAGCHRHLCLCILVERVRACQRPHPFDVKPHGSHRAE